MGTELISEETAKAIQETAKTTGKVVDLADKFGGFVGRVLGTVPEDAVGLFGGDLLHHVRQRNRARLAERTDEILRKHSIRDSVAVSPTLAIPLLSAAQDESRPELQKLWARLLAAAMDPNRVGQVRLEFIEVVKLMEPLDADVLEKLREPITYSPSAQDFMARAFNASNDEVEVAFQNLHRLGLIRNQSSEVIMVQLTARGRALLNAVRD